MRVFPLFPDPRQRVERADSIDPAADPRDLILPTSGDRGGVLLLQTKPGRASDRVPFQSGAWRRLLDGVRRKDAQVHADTLLRDGAADFSDRHIEWVKHTIDERKPRLIIAFGAPAHDALLGDRPNVAKVRRCYAYLSDGTPVVCMPSIIGRVGMNRFLKKWVSEDLGWAIKHDFPPAPANLEGRSIETIGEAWDAVRHLASLGSAGVDTETFGVMYTEEFKVTQLALGHASLGYAYHWGPSALDPEGDLVKPLKWLLRNVPLDGHNLKYDVLALWCHLGVRAEKTRWCTRLAAKIARADTSARLDDQSYRVGWGGHKNEADRAVDEAKNIITRLRTAVLKPVVLSFEYEQYTTKTGKTRRRKVPTSDRPPTSEEVDERIHKQWSKTRQVNGVKTTWSTLTGLESPTADWITAVKGPGKPKTYAFGLADEDVMERYVCRDTISTCQLVAVVDADLVGGRRHTWESFMSGVTDALSQIQFNGLPVSVERLLDLAARLDVKEMDARRQLAAYLPRSVETGKVVDVLWTSTDQLKALLFTKPGVEFKLSTDGEKVVGGWGLPVLKKTKTGAASTGRTVLDELRRQSKHPGLGPLLDLREATKLQSNYARGMLPFVGPDGRIHCTLTPMGAETGRCSCSRPNLQTIPSRSREFAKLVKSCYVAPAGYKLVQIDYATLELRVMAFLSGEQSMIDSFLAGRDLHRDTARMISDVVWGSDFDTCGLGYSFFDLISPHNPDAAVLYADRDGRVKVGENGWTQAHEDAVNMATYGRCTPDVAKLDPIDDGCEKWSALAGEQKARRKVAKVVNFATAYGQGPRSMAEQWGISEDEARAAQNAVMGKRKRLTRWFAEQRRQCAAKGYVDTWWDNMPSTRRYLVDIASGIDDLKGHAERAAGNTPVQGTGSHFCMASLVAVEKWIREDGIDAQTILSVHDSGLWLVHEDDLPEFIDVVPGLMTQWASMGTPITVDVEVGDDWGHLKAA